jgi:superfamily II DNA or RNA helicase
METARKLTALPHQSAEVPGNPKPFSVFKRFRMNWFLVPRFFYLREIRKKNDRVLVKELPLSETGMEWKGDLYPEQTTGVGRLLGVLSRTHGAIGKGRCGTGKTVVGTYVISRMKSRKTMILVDQKNLAEQWTKETMVHLPEAKISFIMPVSEQRKIRAKMGLKEESQGAFDASGNVVIASAQTLMTYDRDTPIEVSLLIVDETHKFSAPCFSKAIYNLSFRYSLGLTATDQRPDRLGWIFRDLLGTETVQLSGRRMSPRVLSVEVRPTRHIRIENYAMKWCQQFVRVTTPRACADCRNGPLPCEFLSGGGKKTHFTAMMLDLSKDPGYNNAIVSLVLELHKLDHQILVFSKFKDHLRYLEKECRARGVKDTALYFGGMDKDKAIKPQVTFLTYSVGKHGLDAPWKSAVVTALPISEAEQAVGRIERVYLGKKIPIIIDPFVPSPFFRNQWRHRDKFYREAGYARHFVRDAAEAGKVLVQLGEVREEETAADPCAGKLPPRVQEFLS